MTREEVKLILRKALKDELEPRIREVYGENEYPSIEVACWSKESIEFRTGRSIKLSMLVKVAEALGISTDSIELNFGIDCGFDEKYEKYVVLGYIKINITTSRTRSGK